MTASTMVWVGVICLALFVFITYIKDYEAEQSFWADLADGLKETTEIVAQLHTSKIEDKDIIVFKGQNKKRTYFLDKQTLNGLDIKVGQKVRLTYILDPERTNKNERAVVLSFEIQEITLDSQIQNA